MISFVNLIEKRIIFGIWLISCNYRYINFINLQRVGDNIISYSYPPQNFINQKRDKLQDLYSTMTWLTHIDKVVYTDCGFCCVKK